MCLLIYLIVHCFLKGGNLSAANQDGRTALHVASREGKLPVVQYLLHQGASVHAKDNQGHTPLMDAIYGKHLSIISLIAKTGGILSTHPVRLAMELCRYQKKFEYCHGNL